VRLISSPIRTNQNYILATEDFIDLFSPNYRPLNSYQINDLDPYNRNTEFNLDRFLSIFSPSDRDDSIYTIHTLKVTLYGGSTGSDIDTLLSTQLLNDIISNL